MTERPRPRPVRVLVGFVVVAVLLVAAWAAVSALGRSAPGAGDGDGVAATVMRIVDGDTIIVSVGGEERRVRLLNIDAPESARPEAPVECLGPEAADYLEDLIPPGSSVTLRYDVERLDDFGRDLAAVFVGETLINAEVARAGLAEALVIQPNDAFYADVLEAVAEAERRGLGLHAPNLACP